jgi:ubiquinone/menaquinone biosynthesis C-methylase UbiE
MAKDQSTILDVGCGAQPKGTVNVDFVRRGLNPHVGEFMRDPHAIQNFVIADACHLPFKTGTFSLVVSNHVIEHVPNPKEMFGELCRVSKDRVLVRCPHKRGSGAKRPHHIHYFDETWFNEEAESIGFTHYERISNYDFPLSARLPNKVTDRVRKWVVIWKVLRHIEFLISRGVNIPYEVECGVYKSKPLAR